MTNSLPRLLSAEHSEGDYKSQQVTTAPGAQQGGRQGPGPVDSGPGSGQQRLYTGQHRIGAHKKSIQSRVHVYSSDRFTVMMELQQRNAGSNGGSIPHNIYRLQRYSEMISYA